MLKTLGPWFVDTNILLRLSSRQEAEYPDIRLAVNHLRCLDQDIFCAAQNIAEFWNVSTRPADKNCVSNLLTLNGADFRRFPDILPIKPAELP